MKDDEFPAWQPAGEQLLDVEHLFSESVFEEMELLCPDLRSEKQPLCISVLNVAAWLNAMLHYEARPTSAEIRREKLEPLAAALARVEAVLNDLDHDARAALVKAATVYTSFDGDVAASQHESSFHVGPARYRDAVERIDDLRRWTIRATDNLPPSKSGRPPEDAKLDAVRALGELWLVRCGMPPTRTYDQATHTETGPFTRFCELGLMPVLRRSLKMSEQQPQRFSKTQRQRMSKMSVRNREMEVERMASLQHQIREVVKAMNKT